MSFRTEGAWGRQGIPDRVADGFRGADVVINLGMGTIRAPDTLPVGHGVLSYDHGGPHQVRDSLPSYYGLEDGVEVQGVSVQRLSDTFGGVEVLTKAYARVVPWSYAQTLREAHSAAVPLLAKAITALEKGQREPVSLQEPDYGLPTNASVVRQSAVLGRRKLGHLARADA